VGVCRQQEGRASADSLADLKASAARELAEVRKQAKEQLQQSGNEAQVKLAAVQSAREALQGQVEKLQDSNVALHQQLADAHGKVCTCCSAGICKPAVVLIEGLPICLSACLPVCVSVCLPVCVSVCLCACLPDLLIYLSVLQPSCCPCICLSVSTMDMLQCSVPGNC